MFSPLAVVVVVAVPRSQKPANKKSLLKMSLQEMMESHHKKTCSKLPTILKWGLFFDFHRFLSSA
jgi:hypothetical protein